VIDGYSGVDEKAITEKAYQWKKERRRSYRSHNKQTAFKFKATRVGKDTMLAQIIKIVEGAMGSKTPIQLLADKVSLYFVPTVLSIAILSSAVWLILASHLSLL